MGAGRLMDPVLMVGAWAAAIVSVVAAANLMYKAFMRAVRGAVTDEFDRVWREFDEQDKWQQMKFSELQKQIALLHDQVVRLERVLSDRVA